MEGECIRVCVGGWGRWDVVVGRLSFPFSPSQTMGSGVLLPMPSLFWVRATVVHHPSPAPSWGRRTRSFSNWPAGPRCSVALAHPNSTCILKCLRKGTEWPITISATWAMQCIVIHTCSLFLFLSLSISLPLSSSLFNWTPCALVFLTLYQYLKCDLSLPCPKRKIVLWRLHWKVAWLVKENCHWKVIFIEVNWILFKMYFTV